MNVLGVAVLLVVVSLRNAVCDDVFADMSGSRVMFVDQRMTFAEAETNCKGKNATLVEMWTLEEWKEIAAWFEGRARRLNSAVWIGLTDIMEEGTFLWISGCPFSPEIGNVSWERGQPNNLVGNQHCAALYGAVPKMYDMSCGIKLHSVCQKRAAAVGIVTADLKDEHYDNFMDDNTIVHIVVSLSAVLLIICSLALQACCKLKGSAINRADDTIPLHEVKLSPIAHNV